MTIKNATFNPGWPTELQRAEISFETAIPLTVGAEDAHVVVYARTYLSEQQDGTPFLHAAIWEARLIKDLRDERERVIAFAGDSVLDRIDGRERMALEDEAEQLALLEPEPEREEVA